MDLLLVRHFAPLIGAGVCYGASDIGCDLAAHTDALQRLKLDLPPADLVLTSPLRRCRLLAEAFGLKPAVPLAAE